MGSGIDDFADFIGELKGAFFKAAGEAFKELSEESGDEGQSPFDSSKDGPFEAVAPAGDPAGLSRQLASCEMWIVRRMAELAIWYGKKPVVCDSLEETELPGSCKARLLFDRLIDSCDRSRIKGSFGDLKKACGRVQRHFSLYAGVVAAANKALRASGRQPVSFRALKGQIPSFEAPDTTNPGKLDDALDRCYEGLNSFIDMLGDRIEKLSDALGAIAPEAGAASPA